MNGELEPITIAVAGARDSGKTRLIAALDTARTGDLTLVRARLSALGLDETWIDRLKVARWVEVPGYTVTSAGESARDRATRADAVQAAVEADLLVLVIDGRRGSHAADVAFAQAWDRWYIEHPGLDVPPALAVVTAVDTPEFGGGAEWKPPYQWSQGRGAREEAVRARLEALRAMLPPTFRELVAVGLPEHAPFGIVELLLPALSSLMHLAERSALIRHLHRVSTRSKARRLVSQVGEQGRWLWKNLTGHRNPAPEPEPAGDSGGRAV